MRAGDDGTCENNPLLHLEARLTSNHPELALRTVPGCPVLVPLPKQPLPMKVSLTKWLSNDTTVCLFYK